MRVVRDVALHHRSGARLRTRWRVAEGGARERLGLHDTKLGVDCTFLPTARGLRCVPDPEELSQLTYSGDSFRDDACSTLVAVGAGDVPSKFITMRGTTKSECKEAPLRVFEAENPQRVTRIYGRFSRGDCHRAVETAEGIETARVGREVTAEFVTATRVVVGYGEGRLRAAYFEASDGAVAFSEWLDPSFDAACTITLAADGEARCVPDGLRLRDLFADSDCKKPGMSTACVAPRFMTKDDARCPTRTHVFHTGSSTPGDYFMRGGVECFQQTLSSRGKTTYSPGKEIDPAFLVATPRVDDRSPEARLRRNLVAVGELRATAPGHEPWHDTKLGVDCHFWPATDGVVRCLPSTGATTPVEAFEDAECARPSKPVYTAPTTRSGCSREAPSPPRYALAPAHVGDPTMLVERHYRARVNQLEPWPTETPIYVRQQHGCARMPIDEVAGLLVEGAEIPPTAFEGAKTSLE